jgi:hypothetical protein
MKPEIRAVLFAFLVAALACPVILRSFIGRKATE